MASKGDYALEQEKYSAELIEKANNEKDGLLKLAKDLSEKELNSYNEEKRIEYDDKVTELNINEKFLEEHKTVHIYTEKENYDAEIFSVYSIGVNIEENNIKDLDFEDRVDYYKRASKFNIENFTESKKIVKFYL